MPLVDIKVFEGKLSQTPSQELIQKVTEIIVPFAGENLRQATRVAVQEDGYDRSDRPSRP
jgi:phenylpyruvate tautomerase PptA (4-oxalocrotonate tautomerase family)